MGRVRKFDYDVARSLRDSGMTYVAIAERLGVTDTAVYFACNDDVRRRSVERVAAWQRQGVCVDCGTSCSRHGGQPSNQQRCRSCANRARTTSVRDSELWCYACRAWKRDAEFSKGGRQSRRGRHHQCTACQTEAKRKYRAGLRIAA